MGIDIKTIVKNAKRGNIILKKSHTTIVVITIAKMIDTVFLLSIFHLIKSNFA
jgi:hypothetical protein